MKCFVFVSIFLSLCSAASAAQKDFKISNRLENNKKARILVERTGASGVLARVVLSKGESKSFDFSTQNGGVRVSVYNDATNERMVDRVDFRGNEEVEIQTTSRDGTKWRVVRK